MCVVWALPLTASAQRPICPEPVPQDPYFTACNIGGQLATARLLADFAVDHLLKSHNLPFWRRPIDLLRTYDAGWVVTDEHPLVQYLQLLSPLKFTRLDTSTGTVEWEVTDRDRHYETSVSFRGGNYDFSWNLPSRLLGGYWRTPGVLQVAFWETQRPVVGIRSPEGFQLNAEISCIALSTEGVRIVTSDPAIPDVLLQFGPCR